jgi:1-acyl-sn-glycerol-3-phosphate acyltransferase
VAQRRLGLWRRVAVMLVVPVMTIWTRCTWTGQDRFPPEGGVIVVANHISHFDPLTLAHYVYKAGRWPRFLGKASLWRLPVIGFLLRKTQQIPVERGSVEAVKSLDALIDALQSGGAVVIYPEGTTTREPQLWPMRGKTGAARLALATGVPVIPVAMWGPQQVFDPRTQKLVLKPRAPVSVTAGPPVDLSRWRDATPTRAVLDEMTDAILLDIQDLLVGLRGGTPPPELFDPPHRRSDTDPHEPTTETEKR